MPPLLDDPGVAYACVHCAARRTRIADLNWCIMVTWSKTMQRKF